MSTRLPPLLEPYLSLPSEASLILLTSILGASTNWVVLRFLYSALKSRNVGSPEDEGDAGEVNVCLVSFMRDVSFWKEGARKLGLDLDKLVSQKRFLFLDGLTGLYLPNQQAPHESSDQDKILENPTLSGVAGEIQIAVKLLHSGIPGSKTILIIDQMDLLLATGGNKITPVNLEEMLLGLRHDVHGTIMTLSADAPLVFETQTPLERNHAAFLLSISHQADLVMSMRLLDSGTARDVSGVIRVTPRVQGVGGDERIGDEELLYFVGGDGGVKAFERGQ